MYKCSYFNTFQEICDYANENKLKIIDVIKTITSYGCNNDVIFEK